MSKIGEALNRINKNNNLTGKNKSHQISFKFSYKFLTLILFLFAVIYFTLIFQSKPVKLKINLPDVDKYRKILTKEIRNYNNFHEDINLKLNYLIESNQIDKLKNLLHNSPYIDQKKKLYYSALIELKVGNLINAENILREYIKNYGTSGNVLYYLGEIEFKKGNLKKAIKYFKKVKNKNFNTNLKIAIIDELLGSYREAIDYYSKSLAMIKNPFLKKRIIIKLYLLKNYAVK